MQSEQIHFGCTLIIHDPELLPVEPWLFQPQALHERKLVRLRTKGRRSAYVFAFGNREYVLRHYWRGGLIGRLVADRYLWLGRERSRPLREWQLLQALYAASLPVPRPAALRIERCGPTYRADLITERLPSTDTLADRLEQAPLDASVWRQIGVTISRLHRRGAYHADLNARNILLGAEPGEIHVIDWDRGELRRPAASWQQANLDRLRRSLDKLSGLLTPFHFRAQDFEVLRAGYATPDPDSEVRSGPQIPNRKVVPPGPAP